MLPFQTNVPLMPMQPAMMGGNSTAQNITGMDIDIGPVASRGKGGLNIQFFYARIRIENAADAMLNGTFQDRLCVAKQPKGDRLTTAIQSLTEEQAMAMFPNEFSAFKRSEAVPTNGTPLHELPGISQAQIAMLVLHGIRSVEDLADMQQASVNQMGPDMIQASRLAKRWIEAKTEAAPLIEAAKNDLRISQLTEQLAAAMAQVSHLSAQVEIINRIPATAPAAAVPGAVSMDGFQIIEKPDDDYDPHLSEAELTSGGIAVDNSELSMTPVALPGLNDRPARGRR